MLTKRERQRALRMWEEHHGTLAHGVAGSLAANLVELAKSEAKVWRAFRGYVMSAETFILKDISWEDFEDWSFMAQQEFNKTYPSHKFYVFRRPRRSQASTMWKALLEKDFC